MPKPSGSTKLFDTLRVCPTSAVPEMETAPVAVSLTLVADGHGLIGVTCSVGGLDDHSIGIVVCHRTIGFVIGSVFEGQDTVVEFKSNIWSAPPMNE